MKLLVKLFFVVMACSSSGCAHTEQSSRASASPPAEEATEEAKYGDDWEPEVDPNAKGRPCREILGPETCASLRRVGTQPAGR
jgi:hypothetical protein